MRNEKENRNILFTGAITMAEETIWISLLEMNGLVKINVNTGDVQFVDCFKDEKYDYQLHTQIISYRNKLFFVPWNAENIAVYDIRKGELRNVSGYRFEKKGYFAAGLVNGADLYLVSAVSVQIIRIDMDSEKIVDVYELENFFEEEPVCLIPPMKINNSIWKISEDKNEAWKFDLQSGKYMKCEHTFCDGKMIAGCRGKDCIWIIGDNNRLYQLSKECRYMAQYDIEPVIRRALQSEKPEWIKCICSEHVLSVIFYDRNCMFKIPLVEGIPVIKEYKYIKFDSAFFPDNYDNLVIMLNNRALMMEDEEEKEVTFHVDHVFFTDMLLKNGNRIKETESYGAGLNRYLENLCGDRADVLPTGAHNGGTAGKRIFDSVKEG